MTKNLILSQDKQIETIKEIEEIEYKVHLKIGYKTQKYLKIE